MAIEQMENQELSALSRASLSNTHELRRSLKFIKRHMRSCQGIIDDTDYTRPHHATRKEAIKVKILDIVTLVDECIAHVDEIVQFNNQTRREQSSERISLYQLELSPSVLKLLKSAGITNIDNLTNKTAKQLLLIPKFSERNVSEIKRKLSKFRLNLSNIES